MKTTVPAKPLTPMQKAVGWIGAAIIVGALGGAFEYALFVIINPEGGAAEVAGAGDLVWGVRGTWQLIAHKVFAFGWLVPALSIAALLLTLPLAPLYKRIGLEPRRIGLAAATAFIIAVEAAIGALYISVSRPDIGPAALTPIAILAPAAFIITWALVAACFHCPPVRRILELKALPIMAAGIAGLAAVLSFAPLPDTRPPARGPNVLLITIDALRADKVGARPGGDSLTPNIDRFTGEATAFDRYVVVAPWTLPSLATMHTGLYPGAHCAGTSLPLGTQFRTLAELFSKRGYDTGAVVANKLCEPRFGVARGFRYYRSVEMNRVNLATRLYYTRLLFPISIHADVSRNTTPLVERRAQAYLSHPARGRRPFFMWIHFLDPHDPYDPPPEYVAPAVNEYRGSLNVDEPTFQDKVVAEALYDGEIRQVDEAVGRLLGTLKRTRNWDNTIVVITSDHGEEFWEHGALGHGQSFYDELLVVPFIVKAPEFFPPGKTVDKQVSEIDFFATVCEMCNLNPDVTNQSRSFLSVGRNGVSDNNRPAFASTPTRGDLGRVAYMYKLKKYIKSGNGTTWEIYDISNDPAEKTPIISPGPDSTVTNSLSTWIMANETMRSRYKAGGAVDPMVEQQLKSIGYIR